MTDTTTITIKECEVGDQIEVPHDGWRTITGKYQPYSGFQSVITDDGLTRQFKLETEFTVRKKTNETKQMA
jgi:hypothetical protein